MRPNAELRVTKPIRRPVLRKRIPIWLKRIFRICGIGEMGQQKGADSPAMALFLRKVRREIGISHFLEIREPLSGERVISIGSAALLYASQRNRSMQKIVDFMDDSI
jgi:hypothetical protein